MAGMEVSKLLIFHVLFPLTEILWNCHTMENSGVFLKYFMNAKCSSWKLWIIYFPKCPTFFFFKKRYFHKIILRIQNIFCVTTEYYHRTTHASQPSSKYLQKNLCLDMGIINLKKGRISSWLNLEIMQIFWLNIVQLFSIL